jgi:hypothetical protein
MISPALAALERELRRKTKTPNQVAVTAARDVLDRAGFKPTDQVELSGTVKTLVTIGFINEIKPDG